VVAAAMLLPALYLVVAAAGLPTDRIVEILLDAETARLAGRTVLLGTTVTAGQRAARRAARLADVRSDLPAGASSPSRPRCRW
jgi:hypothetical protein